MSNFSVASFNRISTLPRNMSLMGLQNLKLQSNRLTTFMSIKTLKVLDLRSNYISAIPPRFILDMKPLRELYLSNNPLFSSLSLSEVIKEPRLEILELKGCNLTGELFLGPLLSELREDRAVRIPKLINLANNPLNLSFTGSFLPREYTLLDILCVVEEIVLDNCGLSGDIGQLCSAFDISENTEVEILVKRLSLNHNELDGSVPPVIRTLSSFSAINNGISGVHSETFHLVDGYLLEKLDLSGNAISGPIENLLSGAEKIPQELIFSRNKFFGNVNPFATSSGFKVTR